MKGLGDQVFRAQQRLWYRPRLSGDFRGIWIFQKKKFQGKFREMEHYFNLTDRNSEICNIGRV